MGVIGPTEGRSPFHPSPIQSFEMILPNKNATPFQNATDGYQLRYSLGSILLLITGLAIGLGIGTHSPDIAIWISAVLIAAYTVIAATRAGVEGYRRMFGRYPSKLVPLGDCAGFSVLLASDQLLVGRNSCCDVAIFSPWVSGHHCRLFFNGKRLFVEDLRSRNGTRVNGRSVQAKRLLVGDKISIADREFMVA